MAKTATGSSVRLQPEPSSSDSSSSEEDVIITKESRRGGGQLIDGGESEVSVDDAGEVEEMAMSGFIVNDETVEAEAGCLGAADGDDLQGSAAEPVRRATGNVTIREPNADSKRNRVCGFQMHHNGGAAGDWLPVLNEHGKQIKSGAKCGKAGCGFLNHCKHCSVPGTETCDITHHDAQCPTWLATQQPASTTAANSPFVLHTAEHQYLITISCGGEHCPVEYYNNIAAALKKIVDGGSMVLSRVLVVQEVGKTHIYRHVHIYVRGQIPQEGEST